MRDILENDDINNWPALKLSYERVSGIANSHQSRLHQFGAAYLVALAALLSWFIPKLQNNTQISVLGLLIFSVLNTTYIIFYSYNSIHFIEASRYLNWIAKKAEKFKIVGAEFLRWDPYFAVRSKYNKSWLIINIFLTSWRLIPLIINILLPFIIMIPYYEKILKLKFDLNISKAIYIILFIIIAFVACASFVLSLFHVHSVLAEFKKDAPKYKDLIP